MGIIKSINVAHGGGVDYRYIRSLYYCPLTFFFFLSFFWFSLQFHSFLFCSLESPLRSWPGLQELAP